MKLSDFTGVIRKLPGSSGGNFWGKKSFMGFVVVPILLVTAYYVLLASGRFVSESKIVIKQAQWETTSTSVSPMNLLLGYNPTGREDAFYLKEYLYSADMLAFLDSNLGLRKAYQDGKADFFSRLSGKASYEDFLEYYRDHVEITFDEMSSVMTIRTEGFIPETSKRINELILVQSERFVNGISQKIATDQNAFIEVQLSRAKDDLQKAKEGLIGLQKKYGVYDPQQQATSTGAVVTSLESVLNTQEADLNTLLTYVNETAPQVVAQKSRVASLKQQIAKEKKRLAGREENDLSDVAALFMSAKADLDFKTEVYKATMAALEKSRLDASKKIKTIVTVASPTLPDEAEYPRKIYIISLFSIVITMVYGIVRLILSIINEHAEEV